MIAGMAFRGFTLHDGPVLRLERRFDYPTERLCRALTLGELAQWFPSDAPMEVVERREPEPARRGAGFDDELRFELRPEVTGAS